MAVNSVRNLTKKPEGMTHVARRALGPRKGSSNSYSWRPQGSRSQQVVEAWLQSWVRKPCSFDISNRDINDSCQRRRTRTSLRCGPECVVEGDCCHRLCERSVISRTNGPGVSIRVEWRSYYVFSQEDDQNGFFKEPHRVNADDQQYWRVPTILNTIIN